MKDITKVYHNVERTIQGKTKEHLNKLKSAKVTELRARVRQLKHTKQTAEVRKRISILARIEDKIPATFFEERERKKMSFLGKV